MPWVRSHYRRPSGFGGWPSTWIVVLAVVGILFLVYLITTR